MPTHLLFTFLIGFLFLHQAQADYAAVSPDKTAAVATVHPLATQAALDAIAKGGNAIDAAVAAALTLGVVDGHNSGIGGGCFVLIHWADGRVEAIDGREMAPGLAHRDMYVRKGKVVPELSRIGALAVGVPGSVAAFEYLIEQGGKLSFADSLLPAAALAEQGFAIDRIYAKRLLKHEKSLRAFKGSASVLLDENAKAWTEGHLLQQQDLAKTYRGIAEQGSDYFYRGELAQAVAAWMQNNDGIISAEDFAAYQLKKREPIKTAYRQYSLYGFPPPSSGGVHVAQILTMLEDFDLAGLSEADRYHVVAEAMKLAFADRAYWLGDSDFTPVPKGLIDKKYNQSLSQKINQQQTTAVATHGTPPRAEVDLFGKHTTHIATADKAGNWVAITTTLNTNFGSKVIVPGTGVLLNNQMDDFSAQPGAPNIYGLVGTEANSIQPGKRPLSSMSPTLVLKDGKPLMTLGAAGGPTIITQVVQAVMNRLDLNKPLAEALMTPRIHHQWKPESLYVEKTLPQAIRTALEEKGHHLKTMAPYGSTQAIAVDAEGEFVSVTEPRVKIRNNLE